MSDYKRQQPGQDCPPAPKDPADQPHPPGVDTCADLPTSTPPTLDPPTCPEPSCKCPGKPASDPNCIEQLIARQAAEIAAAKNAENFKKDLETLLGKAKEAAKEYTRPTYEKLVKQWTAQDADLAELLRKLVCALPCWKCVIECYVCPLLDELHKAEKWLYDDGKIPEDVHTKYDLLYWHGRNREAKERQFNRIKGVLAVWEKPAATIQKTLDDIKTLIDAANKQIGTDPPRVLVDVLLRIVPLHLAIAPPSGTQWVTKIGKEFTEFCECNTGTPDNCCGPDVGEPSLRQRLIGPQPYLIDPDEYFKVICCLVEKRYGPAKDALGKADADWHAVDDEIKRLKALVENGLKTLEKDAKAAIPTVVDCCVFESGDDPGPKQTAR
jgi:hypothetical protein